VDWRIFEVDLDRKSTGVDKQFIIGFPSLKKIDEIAHFQKGFPLSTVDNMVIKVEHSKSSVIAKMTLPSA
jgi:hypothetical protein